MRQGAKNIFFLITILLLAAVIRFYRLDEIPGEIYGDIVIVFNYVGRILGGLWPFDFVLSPGPLYYYAIVPIVILLGQSYLTLKIASVLISLVTIVVTFLFAKEFTTKKVALITVLFTSVSTWVLIFGRLGNSQIIIPLLVSLAYYFLLKWFKSYPRGKSSRLYCVLTIISASLGWYTYPQTFILPILVGGTIGIIIFLEKKVKKEDRRKDFYSLIGLSILCSFPFVNIVINNPSNFASGYIGGHIFVQQSLMDIFRQILINLIHALGMFHFRGDMVFRSNIPGMPHLDRLSGLFFILGIIILLKRNLKKAFLFGIIPTFILLLPSVMVLNQPQEVPSASRSIGITPFVYLFTAGGLFWTFSILRKRVGKFLSIITVTIFFVYISYANLSNYFFRWVYGLPNHNIPYTRIIATYIDSLPENTIVHLASCCFTEGPSWDSLSIYYSLQRKKGRENIVYGRLISACDQINPEQSSILIFNPDDRLKIEKLERCFPKGKVIEHSLGEDKKVFVSLSTLSE